jgi:hypothetical protein
MARVNAIQTAFTAGEFSPRMYGRVDFDKYRNAAKTIENMLVYPQGGVGRRPGSIYVAEAKSSAAKCRLGKFEFSDTQAYILEFGNTYMRFYTELGQLQSSGSAVEVSTPYTTAQLFDLHFTQSADELYIVHNSHPTKKLVRNSATSFALSSAAFVDGPYLPLDTSGITLTLSGTSGSITVTASSSLFVATDSTGGSGSGAYDRLLRILDGSTWRWLKITAYTNGTTVTAAIQDSATFSGTGAFSSFRLGSFSDTTGYPRCVTFFQNRLALAGTTSQPQTLWMSKTDDYLNFTPGSDADDPVDATLVSNQVNVIEWLVPVRRSLFASTISTEWEITSTTPPVTPSNVSAFPRTFEGGAHVQPIQAKNLVAFVQNSQKRLHAINFSFATDNYIAPDLTLLADHITGDGFDQIDFQRSPEPTIWGLRADGELAGSTFVEDQEINAWHRHISGGISGTATITVTDYSNIAVGTKINITKADGTEVTFTSEASSGDAPSETNGWRPNESNDTTADNIYTAVNAHADFTVANPAANVVTITQTSKTVNGPITITTNDPARLATTNQTNALIESMAVIHYESATTKTDQIWWIVQRNINGSTKRYIEYLDTSVMSDSCLTYSGSGASSVSGLGHLEGQIVSVRVKKNSSHDWSVIANKTVSSGAVALGSTYTNVQIGLPYTHKVEPLRIEYGAQAGASLTRKRRSHEASLLLRNSVGGEVNGDPIILRSSADELGQGIPPFTGVYTHKLDSGWSEDQDITISGSEPLEFNLTSLVIGHNVSDG